MTHPTVVLIGRTSHAGKSTVARVLAEEFECDIQSSDRLAKHPGRPWPGPSGRAVPPHVAEHYASYEPDELLADVLAHYEANVLPRVRELVERRESLLDPGCLVIEGSALWPEFVTDLAARPGIRAVWLAPAEDVLRERIHAESSYARVDENQRHLIDRFLARTLLYNRRMIQVLERTGLPRLPVESESPADLARSAWRMSLSSDLRPGSHDRSPDPGNEHEAGPHGLQRG